MSDTDTGATAAAADSPDLPVVVVLGAGIGGQAVAAALAHTARLVVVDRDLEIAARAVVPVIEAGGEAEPVVVDLTDLAAVSTFCGDLLDRFGRVDAVIHLVGGWQGSTTVDAAAIEQWRALLPGIVGTVQATSVAFREALTAAPHGRYVMITSTSVATPSAGNAAYAAAKAAAEAWVRALGAAFTGTPAAACVVAVKALVDPATRAAHPERKFPGYTDTPDLGAAVAALVTDPDLPTLVRIDLTQTEA